MSLEQTIKDTLLSESVDLDMRLQQLVRAGLMPANTLPLLRKGIAKVQGGYPLVGAERDIMANFLNAMMFIVLGDDSIFNKARTGAKHYATEEVEAVEEGENKEMKDKDPCWKGYEMVGMKKKGGKQVPNCVPANEEVESIDEISKTTLKSYSAKAEKQTRGNQPHGTDALRKRTNREKGLKSAYNKYYGYKTKIHATEEVEQIDELSKNTLKSYLDKKKVPSGTLVANTNDKDSMRKYTNRVVGGVRAAKKLLTKESRRTEALADIAAFTQMNESYKTTFNAALEQYGIKSPSELDEEKRKEFFNFVDQNYKKGDN